MSLVLSKNYVPEIYQSSEDFLAVLKLLDLVINPTKQTQYVPDSFNIQTCSEDILPLLAAYVGYEYDYQLPISDNRIIIAAYPILTRNKGNLFGIELAVKTGLKLSGTYEIIKSEQPYNIEIDIENREIQITINAVQYSNKINDLIEYVRPIGFTYIIKFRNVKEYEAKIIASDNPDTSNWIIETDIDEDYFVDHTMMWGDFKETICYDITLNYHSLGYLYGKGIIDKLASNLGTSRDNISFIVFKNNNLNREEVRAWVKSDDEEYYSYISGVYFFADPQQGTHNISGWYHNLTNDAEGYLPVKQVQSFSMGSVILDTSYFYYSTVNVYDTLGAQIYFNENTGYNNYLTDLINGYLFDYYFGLIENIPYTTYLQNDIILSVDSLYSYNDSLIKIRWKFKSTDKGNTFTIDNSTVSPQAFIGLLSSSGVQEFNFDEIEESTGQGFFDQGNIKFQIQEEIEYNNTTLTFVSLESAYITFTFRESGKGDETFTFNILETIGEKLHP